jgi:flagellar L-ring protein precursor FlgH
MAGRISLGLVAAGLAGCATMPPGDTPDWTSANVVPVYPEERPAEAGTIYRPGSSYDLFMDLRARTVGDIVTIELVERTNASKESSANTAKATGIDTGIPVIAGRTITAGGLDILNTEVESENSFSGAADASQSNSLDGSIAVTVARRLPNGNLFVVGEKLITLNQGEEFIRLSGIVRPVDIRPDNSIESTKIADAKITYSGRGSLANANRPGLLSRFFNSPWMPN